MSTNPFLSDSAERRQGTSVHSVVIFLHAIEQDCAAIGLLCYRFLLRFFARTTRERQPGPPKKMPHALWMLARTRQTNKSTREQRERSQCKIHQAIYPPANRLRQRVPKPPHQANPHVGVCPESIGPASTKLCIHFPSTPCIEKDNHFCRALNARLRLGTTNRL
ncbi:hypothetical protein B0H63DRAFT_78021 [Podospora didyma]|uniref:Uncharacterized protein n=1 Tax=Podospora didyma TaxID=330526 RepID=A0AAE0K1V8_9PEZI|nr:hypothetical protein B0H63DRAFT_78021 [Podospora didyma]